MRPNTAEGGTVLEEILAFRYPQHTSCRATNHEANRDIDSHNKEVHHTHYTDQASHEWPTD